MQSLPPKQAQFTLFLVTAIVILTVSLFIFYSFGLGKEDTIASLKSGGTEKSPLSLYVEQCIETVLVPGIYTLGWRGGFINTFPNYLDTEEPIAYHRYLNNNTSPPVSFMEEELSSYASKPLETCVKDYFNLTSGAILGVLKMETTISKDSVNIELDYPLQILHGQSFTEISLFSKSIPLRIGALIEYKERLLNDRYNGNLLYDLSQFGNVEVLVSPYDDTTIVYSLIDNSSKYESPLVFNFAVKQEQNFPPILEFLPDISLTRNQNFSYQLNASDPDGDVLTYYSNVSHLTMDNKGGKFSFIAVSTEEIEFCAKDSKGDTDCRKVVFLVEDE